jgi:hypothetical protein
MHVLNAGDLLELAERGASLGSARRALLLLQTAYPEHPVESIAGAPLSARDQALLAVRARLFGPAIRAQERCASCGEVLELTLTAEAIGLGASAEPFPPAPTGRIGTGERATPIRAVTAGDVAAAEAAPDAMAARAVIAALVAPGAEDAADLDAALEALDPAADVDIALACPTCGATTILGFDVPAFFWRELETRAPRILREVAELARCYHWSERDILAMSPARRAFYLAEARP